MVGFGAFITFLGLYKVRMLGFGSDSHPSEVSVDFIVPIPTSVWY